MRLVYKFNNYKHNDELFKLCRISKDLYNQALYTCITSFKQEKKQYIGYYDLDKILKDTPNLEGQVNYRLLKAQVAQQTLKVVDKSIKSYFKSIKDWKKHKEKYNGMPRMPKYLPKNSYFQLVYPNQSCQIKNGRVYLSRNLSIKIPQWDKYGDKLLNFQQVRVLPKEGYTVIEIVYVDNTIVNTELNHDRYASIDLGINNFVTLVTDFCNPLLYSGRQIKSKNQWFNKRLAKLKSETMKNNKKHMTTRIRKLYVKRNNEINDLMHKVSRHIVRILNENNVGNVVCGRNKGWKDSITLGSKTNQSFVQIPYGTFIGMLSYKCSMCGIHFIEQEESYTSKCDSLSKEKICKHDAYVGERIKRGLFQSGAGKLINADVNGALNIMRKVVGDSNQIGLIIDSGWLFQPKKANNLYYLNS